MSQEGLLWVGQIEVSAQAPEKRLRTLPIELFTTIFKQVIERVSAQQKNTAVPENWQSVCDALGNHLRWYRFTAIWIADGSTLEALRCKLKALKEKEKTLGGKMMMVVEAFSHRPIQTCYSQNSKSNDKTWCDKLLESLPVGGLLI